MTTITSLFRAIRAIFAEIITAITIIIWLILLALALVGTAVVYFAISNPHYLLYVIAKLTGQAMPYLILPQ